MKVIERYAKKMRRFLVVLFTVYDAVTVRMILAISSLAFATALITQELPFTKEAYSIMASVGGNELWALVFALHFVATLWRFLDPVPRPKWALGVNAYGVFIWLFLTLSINFSVGYWAPGTAMECVMVALASWVLFRTARVPEPFTP